MQGHIILEMSARSSWPPLFDQMLVAGLVHNGQTINIIATPRASFQCEVTRDAVRLNYETPSLKFDESRRLKLFLAWGDGKIVCTINGKLLETYEEAKGAPQQIPRPESLKA